MQLFELHNALSRTIGDPVENTGSLFIDGIRYSTRLRAQYMYQAMNDVIIGAVNRLSAAPHPVQSEVMERLFPSMVDAFTSPLPVPAAQIAFVLSAYYIPGLGLGNPIALPVVKSYKAMLHSIGRSSNLQPSDPFIIQRTGGIIQVSGLNTEDLIGSLITINAIKRPPAHNWLADQANGTELIADFFEEFWIPEVLRRSSILAQLDSGEMGTAAQAYPIVAMPQFAQQQQG